MLDSNICIYVINKKPLSFLPKLEKIDEFHTLAISSIVLAELQYGVSNSVHKTQNQINLDAFITKVEILPYCEEAAFFYGKIRSSLQQQGKLIGGNDLLIASHAIAEEAILITNNSSEFKRVRDLKIEI
jgi:tRNA(fMet)-specific endonuclease VapC